MPEGKYSGNVHEVGRSGIPRTIWTRSCRFGKQENNKADGAMGVKEKAQENKPSG